MQSVHIEIKETTVCFLGLIWLIIHCNGTYYLAVGVEHFIAYNLIIVFTV
jgi:hypothetical protein